MVRCAGLECARGDVRAVRWDGRAYSCPRGWWAWRASALLSTLALGAGALVALRAGALAPLRDLHVPAPLSVNGTAGANWTYAVAWGCGGPHAVCANWTAFAGAALAAAGNPPFLVDGCVGRADASAEVGAVLWAVLGFFGAIVAVSAFPACTVKTRDLIWATCATLALAPTIIVVSMVAVTVSARGDFRMCAPYTAAGAILGSSSAFASAPVTSDADWAWLRGTVAPLVPALAFWENPRAFAIPYVASPPVHDAVGNLRARVQRELEVVVNVVVACALLLAVVAWAVEPALPPPALLPDPLSDDDYPPVPVPGADGWSTESTGSARPTESTGSARPRSPPVGQCFLLPTARLLPPAAADSPLHFAPPSGAPRPPSSAPRPAPHAQLVAPSAPPAFLTPPGSRPAPASGYAALPSEPAPGYASLPSESKYGSIPGSPRSAPRGSDVPGPGAHPAAGSVGMAQARALLEVARRLDAGEAMDTADLAAAGMEPDAPVVPVASPFRRPDFEYSADVPNNRDDGEPPAAPCFPSPEAPAGVPEPEHLAEQAPLR